MSRFSTEAPFRSLGRWFATGLLVLFGIASCGGGGSDSGNQAGNPLQKACDPQAADAEDNCGTVFVGLTDAEGDFANYSVDVVSLKLERDDGMTVETMPQSGRIDFTQYQDLTEFFTAAFVPPGVYVAGSITLDYTNAEVFVQVGDSAVQADVVDIDGNPLGVYELDIRLEDRRKLLVARGIPSILTVDFNLTASHSVDTSVDPPRVTAEPFLIADLDPVDYKQIRLRGPLLAVQPDANAYTIAVRPYHLRDGRFGRVRVHTGERTTFEINGEMFEGAAGIAAMATLEELTPTVAFGVLDVFARRFNAIHVFAGSSVPGHGYDVVRGNIVAREGDTLTVRGATVIKSDDSGQIQSIVFNDNVTVQVGPETKVLKTGDLNMDHDIGDLSVGQKVWAFGELTSAIAGELELDATEGRVRMLVTRVSGLLNSTNPGEIEMTAQHFDGRPAGLFDFSGTGVSSADDANPDEYEVETGNLGTGSLAAGDPIRVFGFVTPFGTAPLDFEAYTIVNFSEARAHLAIGWPQGTPTPYTNIGEDGILLDLTNPEIGIRHHIIQGGVFTDLLNLGASPNIVPSEEGPTVFAIKQGHTVQVFFDWNLFVSDLAARLDGTTEAKGMHAVGGYDNINNVFTAKRIWVHLE